MARMYSGKRGKSGSHRPMNKEAKWVTHKPQEIADIVGRLASEGRSSAEIGTTLRDQYGIPSVKAVAGKKIVGMMKEKGTIMKLPEDMLNLLRHAVTLKAHLDKNKHDRYSKRGLELTESKIRRLARYYKGNGMLSKEWQYDLEKAKLLAK
jgi:small subunit ribosomal protein S15